MDRRPLGVVSAKGSCILAKQPLAEVFGFPVDNQSAEAERYRANRLCPYNNRVPSCTKDKISDPLGVCSIFDGTSVAITCPVRFRQDWLITDHASRFFFSEDTLWTALTEVRLDDKQGQSAGNIDIVLVAYDRQGRVKDFGAIEIQAVYISGNIRRPFEYYMEDPRQRMNMNWAESKFYPRPDYLSSSRKRLAPQLLYKGAILNAWGKRQVVVLHRGFFENLPTLPEVSPDDAQIAWMIYDLELDPVRNRRLLVHWRTVYTQFEPAMLRITNPKIGDLTDFIERLQERLDEKFDSGLSPGGISLTDLTLE